ncbi:MAG: hypothetical protein ACRC3A_02515 [Culicoidibacterales bacterium]
MLDELVPLPQAAVTQQKLQSTTKKQYQKIQVQPQPKVRPNESKPRYEQSELMHKPEIVKSKSMNAQNIHNRLQTAEILRESIIISEILAKPIALRKK